MRNYWFYRFVHRWAFIITLLIWVLFTLIAALLVKYA